ncbi:metallopeptidase TldD-related protein [Actinomadura sp. DC4]|uniref:metallopeptidase TldD-related protein n=1 Tax=Actinomadura sp. DC4 TaxID=3055069 RepID=UPI0025AEF875|nr:metallopeptidase TldD-related protein [Actinomadura sp. DC4]MDN3353649.1 metallopeptidase TldD-related protein [Actinomadura sp. DC4]
MSTHRAQDLAGAALAASASDGCVVVAAEHSETNLRWAGNALTTSGETRTRALTVISTLEGGAGTRAGVVTRTVATPAEAADLARASEAAARHAEPASDASPLVEPYAHDDDWDADAAATDATVFDRFVPALAAVIGDWRRSDRSLYGYAEHQVDSFFLATSTGLRRRFDQPDGRLELTGRSGDNTRSSWWGAHTRDFADLDVAAASSELAQRLDWAARCVELPPGRYETILPPAAVADLMLCAYLNASARDADEGRNVFGAGPGGGRVGERLAALPLTLRSDPAFPGLQCAPFDIVTTAANGMRSVFDNGQPVPAGPWIDTGRLADLVRTRSWARRTGARPRPMAGNLILDGGDASLGEMIASTGRGLLLTALWYVREVDPQTLLCTGLTRDGVYLVEDGRVRGAVNNFRFNESPVGLLGRLTEAGRTERALPRERGDHFRRTAMPPVRVPDFNMSTVSDAV